MQVSVGCQLQGRSGTGLKQRVSCNSRLTSLTSPIHPSSTLRIHPGHKETGHLLRYLHVIGMQNSMSRFYSDLLPWSFLARSFTVRGLQALDVNKI